MIVENYPQLKSNENFQRLQDELAGTENRIAVERRRYNEDGAGLQHLHFVVPEQPGGQLRGFTRNDAYFKTEEGARQAPKVNFDFNKPATLHTTPAPAPRLRIRKRVRQIEGLIRCGPRTELCCDPLLFG